MDKSTQDNLYAYHMTFFTHHIQMDSDIGLPIGIIGACIVSSIFFWCTYRNQVEPAGGRGSEDAINVQQAREIQREIALETQRMTEAKKEEKIPDQIRLDDQN